MASARPSLPPGPARTSSCRLQTGLRARSDRRPPLPVQALYPDLASAPRSRCTDRRRSHLRCVRLFGLRVAVGPRHGYRVGVIADDLAEHHRVRYEHLYVLGGTQHRRSYTDVLDDALLILDTACVADAERSLQQQIHTAEEVL